MKKVFAILLAVMASVVLLSAKPKTPLREASLQTNLHCKNCAAKIQDNVAFEKGVHDLKIDVESKVVTVVYNPRKTDVKALVKSIEKLGYKAEVIEDREK